MLMLRMRFLGLVRFLLVLMMTITVTAENGAVASYVLTVDVALSSNTGLSSLSVNGSDVLGSLC